MNAKETAAALREMADRFDRLETTASIDMQFWLHNTPESEIGKYLEAIGQGAAYERCELGGKAWIVLRPLIDVRCAAFLESTK